MWIPSLRNGVRYFPGNTDPNGFLCRKWDMRKEEWLGGQIEFGKGERQDGRRDSCR
jgi:hypothetical protein